MGFYLERSVLGAFFGLEHAWLKKFSAMRTGFGVSETQTMTAPTFCKIHLSRFPASRIRLQNKLN
jgi:hypothetical protein